MRRLPSFFSRARARGGLRPPCSHAPEPRRRCGRAASSAAIFLSSLVLAGTAVPVAALVFCAMGTDLRVACACPHDGKPADSLRPTSCCVVSRAPAVPAGVRVAASEPLPDALPILVALAVAPLPAPPMMEIAVAAPQRGPPGGRPLVLRLRSLLL